jgi:hypothetical protein
VLNDKYGAFLLSPHRELHPYYTESYHPPAYIVIAVVHKTAINKRYVVRLHLKCDGISAETIFRLSAKRAIPFKSARASVQPTTGSLGVRISGSNAGYTMFRGSEGYWLPTPFACFPFTSPLVRHSLPSLFN